MTLGDLEKAVAAAKAGGILNDDSPVEIRSDIGWAVNAYADPGRDDEGVDWPPMFVIE